jgi:zinc protease
MWKQHIRAAIALACLGTAASAAAQPAAVPSLPAGVARGPSVEGLTEYQLANGLRILLIPDPTKPIITVNIVYLVGSRHEGYGETGMAHLLEHLMSYGSPRHPDAKKEQNDRGARRNASTWWDRTNYYETFPASDDNLAWALDLEADRMTNAFVRADILASQMSVVRNELEANENNAAAILEERAFSTAFLWHNYGKSTGGSRTDVERVPIERLQEFYRKYYRPDNAVLVVAGKFDEARALDLATSRFGSVAKPAAPVPVTYTEEPVQDGERSVVLRRVGDVQFIGAAYHIPAAAHPDSSLMSVVGAILTNAPSGRLHRALVDTKKAVSVNRSTYLLREPGAVYYAVNVRRDTSIDAARDTLIATLDSISSTPVTAEEVDRARAELLRTIDLGTTNSDQFALSLTEWIGAGDWRLFFLHRDRIREARAADVQRAALQYLRPSNRTVALFRPEDSPVRAVIPAAPALASVVDGYRGDAVASLGEAFDPTPENIERRTVRTTLANGMRLVTLPKKTRGALVSGVLQLNYGDQASLNGTSAVADAVRQLLTSGTRARTRQQIRDELNRLRAQLSISGSAGRTSVSFQTVAASVNDVLRLIADLLKEASYPEDQLEEARQNSLAIAEGQRSDPQALAQLALARQFNPWPAADPRAVPTIAEQIAGINGVTAEAVRQFHREFYGAAGAELAIVGDVVPAEIRRVATELFASWKSGRGYSELQREFQKIPARAQSIETPDKANAVFMAGMLFNVGEDHADYPALLLANYMLGGHSTSRLYNRIRAKEGLSYSVSSGLVADGLMPRSQWTTAAITNPLNIKKVEAAFRDEIERVLRDGFVADEVAAAKTGWLQGRQVQRSQDGLLALRLQQLEHDRRTMAFDGVLENKIAALTPEAIWAALRRHLDLAQMTIVTAGDF